jgi:hypothetical protein
MKKIAFNGPNTNDKEHTNFAGLNTKIEHEKKMPNCTNMKLIIQLVSDHRFHARLRRLLHRQRRAPPPSPHRSLFSAVAAYRLPDHMPSFRRCKLRQGAKWTKATTLFFGSCDNSPCRHHHRAGTNLKNSRRGKSTGVLATGAKP